MTVDLQHFPTPDGLTPSTFDPDAHADADMQVANLTRAATVYGEWEVEDAWRAFHLMALCAWAEFGMVETVDAQRVEMDREMYMANLVYAMGFDFLEHTYGREAAHVIWDSHQLGPGVEPLFLRGRMRPTHGGARLTPDGRLVACDL